jgi:hypothetical protein
MGPLRNPKFIIDKKSPNKSMQPDREPPPKLFFEHPGAAADAGRWTKPLSRQAKTRLLLVEIVTSDIFAVKRK